MMMLTHPSLAFEINVHRSRTSQQNRPLIRFAWATGTGRLPDAVTRNGYRVVFRKRGDLVPCAVSNMGIGELSELVRLIKETTSSGGRE